MMNLRQQAQILKDNDALEAILNDVEIEYTAQFRSCHPDKLIELQRNLQAVEVLRSTIQSKLMTYLETA